MVQREPNVKWQLMPWFGIVDRYTCSKTVARQNHVNIVRQSADADILGTMYFVPNADMLTLLFTQIRYCSAKYKVLQGC